MQLNRTQSIIFTSIFIGLSLLGRIYLEFTMPIQTSVSLAIGFLGLMVVYFLWKMNLLNFKK